MLRKLWGILAFCCVKFMIKKLVTLSLFFNCAIVCAQTIKTDVLVIGGSPCGVAAAMQCARSKVKTVLIESSGQLCPSLGGTEVTADRNLPSGIWGEFLKHIIKQYHTTKEHDTSYNATLKFNADTAAIILNHMADTVKNLTIKLNTAFTSIKKDGDRWEVTITQNSKTVIIKPRVVIDATDNGGVIKKAGGSVSAINILENTSQSRMYRTSIAMGDDIIKRFDTLVSKTNYPPFPTYFVPLKVIVAHGADNLLAIGQLFEGTGAIYLPLQLTLGQGAGVTAAYCAFFKTATNNLNVRAIQGELLDFKGYMLPFDDIGTDPYWRAIQQVCATGMLRGVGKMIDGNPQFLFMPDSAVTTAEVKPYLLEIYSRAFLWFNREKPDEKFTVGNLVSFMSELTLTDPDNMRKSISRAWGTQYKFSSPFDIKRPITRREFAILANKYLNPFARTVDLDGRMVN
jgi:ribulose 1,5-bisphosphate synthetase/thiazole synthase